MKREPFGEVWVRIVKVLHGHGHAAPAYVSQPCLSVKNHANIKWTSGVSRFVGSGGSLSIDFVLPNAQTWKQDEEKQD